ncbi:MAG: efflux RND transporter periplasmic adaptor subunit, partial [Verrucomicrobiaceae bacterium]
MKTLLKWLLIVGVLGGGGYVAAKRWPDKVPWSQKVVTEGPKTMGRPTTAVVSARDISFAITAAGEITPAEQVNVRPEVSGRVSELPVDIGDEVKKGDLLFTLDDTDLQTEKAQRQIEIEGSKLQVNAARLAVEKMELAFKRNNELKESKLVTQEAFDNSRVELDVAKNALDIAGNNLERSRKALQLVEDKLAKTKITAPFDCTILDRKVSVGQAVSGASGVNNGTDVFIVADLSELIIYAHINQADVTRMRVDQQVQIEVEAVPGLKLMGMVARIPPQATVKNGAKGFSTRIVVKNDRTSGVRPGMTANLTIPLDRAENVLALPLAAVFTDKGERFAYVMQGGKFERAAIRIGVTDYDFAEVISGLNGGETVSVVAPAEEVGNAQQAFGAAARGPGGGRPGGGGG